MPPQHNAPNTADENADMTTPSNDYNPASLHHEPHPDAGHALASGKVPRGIYVAGLIIAVIVFVGIAYRMLERSHDEHKLSESTTENATPTVAVVKPVVASGGSEIALPGNTQAFDDTPIYSRTSGYVKKWFVDLGQQVSAGQLMATIETPELDQQLQVSEANLQSAQADLALANTTSDRYQNLLKSDSVSKQETDVAVSGAAAKKAAVAAAEANVRRLAQLQSFEKIYAPYSGTVTERNVDIGDLIDAGSPATASTSNTPGKEMFRIASLNTLRIFVAVPEQYSPNIKNGDTATLTLQEYPGQIFTGKIARNSNAIDSASRTLNVEVDVDNADHKLLPGAYVFVHFKIPQTQRMLSIPSNTLLFRSQGLQVGIVRGGKVHLQSVTIGKDDGKVVEIASGLAPNDQVILDPSDSLSEGQAVQVATSTSGVQ
jgi:RND family efflux transporter MFP subunit